MVPPIFSSKSILAFDAKGNYIGMILGGKGTETASLPLETIMEEWNIMLQQKDENKE